MKYFYWFCILGLPLAAGAQPLSALVAEALARNPEVLAAQKQYEASRQKPAQEGALPDPVASLGYTSAGGPWPGAGLGSQPASNIGVSLAQELPFPGKRALRASVARLEAGAEYERYLSVRLSVASRVEQTYHELHYSIVSIAFVHRYQALLESTLRITEARYAAGRAQQQDILKAHTQLSVFETQLVQFEQQATVQRIELNRLLNRGQETAIEMPEDVALGSLPYTLDELLAAAREHSPEIAREAKMVQRGQAATSLARRDFYPDFTVSGGYFNQGSMPSMYQVRVDVTLPIRQTRQRAALTGQALALSGARHGYEATAVSLEASIRQEYAAAASARRLAELYEKSVIPEAQLTLDSATASYETGSADFLTLFSSFMNVVEYQLMYHEQVMRFEISRAKLAEMAAREMGS